MARVLTFRFDTFGDVTTASSRLRAWKLGEFLASSGHRVSMNEGEPCDVYVCQKVRPFASLRALREAGALVVYDFDDHLLLEGVESHGVKDEVVAFINAADVVTVGSEYLAEAARNFHRNVFVLENPVDIESAALVREQDRRSSSASAGSEPPPAWSIFAPSRRPNRSRPSRAAAISNST